MSDIELVIKIPEEVKNRLCFGITYQKDIQTVCEALDNGTPLPKGHGRLIDADAYAKYDTHINGRIGEEYIIAPTIIEADTKGVRNERTQIHYK